MRASRQEHGHHAELARQSGTIVFVSHSLPSVAEFCDRALWLDAGRIMQIGQADEVVEAYAASSAQGSSG
jgi:teichoic acid transport system ATP-binding protein